MILRFNVLTAAQTGNSVLLAIALAQGRLAAGLHSALSLGGYIIGAATGEVIILGHRRSGPQRPAVGQALVAEITTLGSLFILWHLAGPSPGQETMDVLIALAAIAMGIQSVAVLRLDAGPTTTYVTGMLTTFTTGMSQWLHLVEAAPAASLTRQYSSPTNPSTGDGPWIYGFTWTAYGVGALASGLFFLHAGEMGLFPPLAAIVIATITEARRGRHL
jgi:uncharacterized membrane protein YoaK (UPF0700 family)